jgi:hypothetical protein
MRKWNRNIEKIDYPKGAESYDYYYWEYYNDNDYDDYVEECNCCQSNCYYCYHQHETYDINDTIMINRVVKVRGLNREDSWVESNIIDMNSIYSKDILRNKKIEEILNQQEDINNTIENILKNKK